MFGLEVLSMFGLAAGNLANASKNNAAQKGMANGMQFQAALGGLNIQGMQPSTLMIQNGQSVPSAAASHTLNSIEPNNSIDPNGISISPNGIAAMNDAGLVMGTPQAQEMLGQGLQAQGNALSTPASDGDLLGAQNITGVEKATSPANVADKFNINISANGIEKAGNSAVVTNSSIPHSFDGIPVITNANVKPEHQNGLMLGMIISNGATLENSPAVLTVAQFANQQSPSEGLLAKAANGLTIASGAVSNSHGHTDEPSTNDAAGQAALFGLVALNMEDLAQNLIALNAGQEISLKDNNAIFAAEGLSNQALNQAFVALGQSQITHLNAKQALAGKTANLDTNLQANGGNGLFEKLGQPIVLLPNPALANNKAVLNPAIAMKPLSVTPANPELVQKVVSELNQAGVETSPLLKGAPNLSNVLLGNINPSEANQNQQAQLAGAIQGGQLSAQGGQPSAQGGTNVATNNSSLPGGFNPVALPEKLAGNSGQQNPILLAQNASPKSGMDEVSLPFAVSANKAAIFGQNKVGQSNNKAGGTANPAGVSINNAAKAQGAVTQAMANAANNSGTQNAAGKGVEMASAMISQQLDSAPLTADDPNAAFEKLLMKNMVRHGNERMGLESATGLKVAGGFDAAGSGFGTASTAQGDGALMQMSTASAAEVATGSSTASFHDISVANQTGRVASSFLASQVGLKIGHAIKADNREFSIRLDPPEMGRIDVKLAIDKSGQVKALISVENKETLAMLQRDSGILERTLHDAGVKTDQNSLNFNLKEENSSHGQERYQERQNHKQAEADFDDFEDDILSNEDITDAVMNAMNLDQGLDIKV